MGCNVFSNGSEIACKKGANKVVAEFPDVCLSPPSPPAGPIPVPYPNSSFSKDMKNGSKTVKIMGGEVMLKDQSYYKSSPLGDEAATKTFGANVITHSITGKTYFVAWSMDVKFEGENVDRHMDLMTSNHMSPPGGTGPMGVSTGTASQESLRNKCAKRRAKIGKKYASLGKEMRKYNPISDARGGFKKHGGLPGLTVPGGHYVKIRQLQRGLKQDVAEFREECNGSGVKLDRNIDQAANKEIVTPPGIARIPIT